jgi:hypothetical protein
MLGFLFETTSTFLKVTQKMRGSVRINVTLRCLSATTVAVGSNKYFVF